MYLLIVVTIYTTLYAKSSNEQTCRSVFESPVFVVSVLAADRPDEQETSVDSSVPGRAPSATAADVGITGQMRRWCQ